MAKPFVYCWSIFAAVMAMTALQAETITIANGNFESVSSGSFTGWNYTSGKTVAGDYSTSPISGSHCAQLIAGSNGGYLYQTVSSSGVSDISLSLDFAILSSGASVRSFSMILASDASAQTTIDSIRVYSVSAGQYELEVYKSSGWVETGLYVNATTDTGTSGTFDGETPAINHLTVVATGQGDSTPSLTITLTGGATNGSYTYNGALFNSGTIASVAFYSAASGKNFLVDNLAVPEPSTLSLLVAASVGFLVFVWRKRAN